MVTHLVFSFLSHRVYGARNSVHSPESRHTKDLIVKNIDNVSECLFTCSIIKAALAASSREPHSPRKRRPLGVFC